MKVNSERKNLPAPQGRKTRKREGPRELEAFQRYCMLGEGRTLKGLYESWKAHDAVACPTYDTLSAWSTRYGWRDRVAAHDERVAKQVMLTMEEREAAQRVDAIRALNGSIDLCGKLIERAMAMEGNTPVKIASAGDLKLVVSTLIEAMKQREVMTGGVSDRQERIDTRPIDGDELDKLLDDFLQARQAHKLQ